MTDSKLLSASKRLGLALKIRLFALDWQIAQASVQEIDQMNIFHASHLAMARAIERLRVRPDHVLVDGNFKLKHVTIPQTEIIKGDSKSLSIACASILAKVWRDWLVGELSKKFPGYALEENKGYPTPAHLRGLDEKGIAPIHRRGYRPVAERIAEEQPRLL